MKRSLGSRFTAWLLIVVTTLGAVNLFAESGARSAEEARHEAFLRGGDAIADALTARSATPITLATLLPPNQPASPPAPSPVPQPPQTEGKNHHLMMWIGIAVTGTIAVYLIQRAAKDHNHIFGPGV